MSQKIKPPRDPDPQMHYEIRIKGHLGSEWSDWFEGLTIALENNGDTLLTGPVVDQAGLHGLLKKVRDLGMPLLSIRPVGPVQAEAGHVDGDTEASDYSESAASPDIGGDK